MFKPSRKVLAIAMLVAGSPAFAQSFPNRPVRIITPYSTGIAPDITARIVAEKLARQWNQAVSVEIGRAHV